MNDSEIKKLVDAGCKRWTKEVSKGNHKILHDRLYVDPEKIGIEYWRDRSGDIIGGKLLGKTISAIKARVFKGSSTYIDTCSGKITSDNKIMKDLAIKFKDTILKHGDK